MSQGTDKTIGGEYTPKNDRKVIIVTDGTSSMTPEMGASYGVHVVPVHILFGTKAYRTGIDIDSGLFYQLLRSSKQLPTTAQPSVTDFIQVYTELAQQEKPIVSIHASVKLTATVESAMAASKELPELSIHPIDTKSISVGLALMVTAAARAADAGKSAEEIVHLVGDLIPKMNIIFTVDTLEYLQRGGRIGGATALIGAALSIKPVLHVQDGLVAPLEKPRTRKRAVRRLLELMEESLGSGQTVHAAVLHCIAPEDAQALAEEIQEQFSCAEMIVMEAGPIIGTHAGPGTLGVAFYGE
jgi:DegV family protein with EDD domain